MKDLIKWYANIEVPQPDKHQNNLKIIWWLTFWSEKRKLRLGFGVHWDFSKQNSIQRAYKALLFPHASEE
jgi:hypothetical protein